MESNLEQVLKEEGYYEIKEIPNVCICGLRRFVFTTGLVYGLDEDSYTGRYCYENAADAKQALEKWNGEGDPSGNWIKHKGRNEYSNPFYKK